MEYVSPVIEAKKWLIASLSCDSNKKLVKMDPALVPEMPEGIYCSVCLASDMIAEFFSFDRYNKSSDYIQIVEQDTSIGQIYHLYALVKTYYVVDNKKIGERHTFINIGGLVSYHYDLHGNIPNEKGEVMNATRVLNTDKFNTDLASFKTPWEMLTKYLSARKIIARRNQDGLWQQKFMHFSQPLPNTYIKQSYLVYSFVLSEQDKQMNQSPVSTSQTPRKSIKYDYGDRTLSIYEGERIIKTIKIDDVRKTEFSGKEYCDWEVVYRMARRFDQEEIPT